MSVLGRTALAALAKALGGLPILGCLPGSPAFRAGIRYGDVLLSVDSQPTPDWDAYLLARRNSGSSIKVKVFRDGAEMELTLELRRNLHFDIETLAALFGDSEAKE